MNIDCKQKNNAFHFLKGGGEMGELTRSYDWSKTPLGEPECWPQSLLTTVSNILSSRFPMFLWWGDDMIQFYNDSYRPSLGNEGKHPKALGQKGIECWPEIWPIISPLIEQVKTTGEPTWNENLLVPIYRNRKIEDVYWTFSYSQVLNDDGVSGGVLVTCMETTDAVVSRNLIKQSENRFRDLALQAPVAIAVFRGKNFIAETANDFYLQLVDKKQSEFINIPLFESLPTTQKFVEPIVNEVVRTGQPYYGREFEVPLKRNGKVETAYFNFIYSPLTESDGRRNGFIVAATEVTGQVMGRKALEDSQAHLALLSDAVPAMIFYIDAGERYRSYNERFREWFNVNETEVIGKTVLEFVGEATYQKIKPHLDIAYSGQQEIYEMFSPLGRWLNIVYTPAKKDGKVVGVIVHASDITSIKEQQHLLEEKEVVLRDAIALADLGTWHLEMGGTRVVISERHAEIFGFSKVNMSVDEWLSIVIDDDKAEVKKKLALAMNAVSRGRYDAEYSVKNPKTKLIQVIHTTGQAYFNADGTLAKMQGIMQDITSQRKMQSALEEKVQIRTEELQAANEELIATNEELNESTRLLIRSNEELAQYAFAASHDLQEPLRKIRVFSDRILHFQSLPNEIEKWALKVNQSAERMTLLIRNLLEFSRLNKPEEAFGPVDLAFIVNEVVKDLELEIAERGAKISADKLPPVIASEMQMQQLFQNLISNALKFASPGKSPEISISSRIISTKEMKNYLHLPEDNNYHHIKVSDNGIGFEQQYAEHIFEIFKRLHGKAQYNGSGIGLALCKRIVTNHGGYIQAESTLGKGSVFHVFLPVKEA
ncbi:MAG TPA: PAS domain-containing protein [Chryseolinea sp.]